MVSLSEGVRKRPREDEEGYTNRRVRSQYKSGLPKKKKIIIIIASTEAKEEYESCPDRSAEVDRRTD